MRGGAHTAAAHPHASFLAASGDTPGCDWVARAQQARGHQGAQGSETHIYIVQAEAIVAHCPCHLCEVQSSDRDRGHFAVVVGENSWRKESSVKLIELRIHIAGQ